MRNLLIPVLGLSVLMISPAWAEDAAGRILYLAGTVSAQRPDGSIKVLSQKSEVFSGEVITTEKDSYAQLNFTDGSSVTLRPLTTFKIETYQFKQETPQSDGLFFRLVKGGLRTVTGLIGKRGNQDAYKLGTASATIGIRGSTGDTFSCEPSCAGVVPNGENLQPGTYHNTHTGAYILTNSAGSTLVGENQFAHATNQNSVPVILPANPGVNVNSMPFSLGVSPRGANAVPPPGGSNNSGQPAGPAGGECVVPGSS